MISGFWEFGIFFVFHPLNIALHVNMFPGLFLINNHHFGLRPSSGPIVAIKTLPERRGAGHGIGVLKRFDIYTSFRSHNKDPISDSYGNPKIPDIHSEHISHKIHDIHSKIINLQMSVRTFCTCPFVIWMHRWKDGFRHVFRHFWKMSRSSRHFCMGEMTKQIDLNCHWRILPWL